MVQYIMVESVGDFFVYLLRPGNIEEFCPVSVDVELVEGKTLPNYEGVRFPEMDTMVGTSQIVKFVKVEPYCKLNLFLINNRDYLEVIFLKEGYTDKAPLISFLFEAGGEVRCKYSDTFETFHRSSKSLDEVPTPTTELQKQCYKFIADELHEYSLMEAEGDFMQKFMELNKKDTEKCVKEIQQLIESAKKYMRELEQEELKDQSSCQKVGGED